MMNVCSTLMRALLVGCRITKSHGASMAKGTAGFMQRLDCLTSMQDIMLFWAD